jgi:rSAM/selenodomain-associated transferase 1
MSLAHPEPVTIAILAKAPVPGTVKTRLMLMLGLDGATTLQERFTRRVVEAAVAADLGPVKLWGSPDAKHPFFAELATQSPVALLAQPSGDLGDRMLAAVIEANAPTIVIGTDCPALSSTHLGDAAEILGSGTDAVVFPAEDGGYVLIGLRKPEPDVFAGIAWGTDTVMIETRRRLTSLGLSWREPATLWDVDRPSDVRRMRRDGFDQLLAGLLSEKPPPLRLETPREYRSRAEEGA